MNYLNIKNIEELVLNLSRIDSKSLDAIEFDSSFGSIRVGSFEIGINAGPHVQSYPDERFDSIGEYESVQVIIIEHLSKDTALLIPSTDERFNYFDWTKYFVYTGYYNKIRASYIGSRVPLKTLYQIIKDLYKVGKLKTFL